MMNNNVVACIDIAADSRCEYTPRLHIRVGSFSIFLVEIGDQWFKNSDQKIEMEPKCVLRFLLST
jgi:hypothetical protein